ncbi:hypothetical protein TIFTF001_013676 [Ficus carica]|uniref:BED-type domain-containing protein n=1 Tax=Ficus carica TaxID=3494 RepID=A0AA88AEQ2_FICCA|nr:hypothetical protein TIFTF001_013676 [Ficus carica]
MAVVREKDACWEYADKLDGNKVRCKFCLRVLNGGISRLKHHLSRLPSKGVNPCSKVRDDVTDRVRAIITSKEDVKETSSTKKQKLVELKSPGNVSASKPLVSTEVASPVAKVFPTVTPMAPPSLNNQENAERSIALFFFENKLDFGIARSSSYQIMVDAITKCGSGFTVEECVAISEPFLKVLREVAGARHTRTKPVEADPIQFDDIDMTSEWVEESDNSSTNLWLDRLGSALDGSDLNTRFSASMFGPNDHIFGL